MITKTVLGPIESWIRYIRKIRALSSRKYRMTKLKKKKKQLLGIYIDIQQNHQI